MAAKRKKVTARKTVKHKTAKKAPARKKTTARKTARKTAAKKSTASKKATRKSTSPRRSKTTFQKMLTAEGWKRLMTGA